MIKSWMTYVATFAGIIGLGLADALWIPELDLKTILTALVAAAGVYQGKRAYDKKYTLNGGKKIND